MRHSHTSRFIPVGYIPRVHGIRGEAVLVLEAESEEVLREELFAFPRASATPPSRENARKLTAQSVRRHHGSLLVSFTGINTRTQAESLRQHTIFIFRGKNSPATDDVYLYDLPGLRVFVQEGDTQREIGVLSSADVPAGQELWTIETPEGKEILFPAVPEFIVELNPDAGTVSIAPPPGLLELYLAEG